MLLELILEFHAWSTSRPEFESASAGDALLDETQSIMNIEREQGMSLFSFGMGVIIQSLRHSWPPALLIFSPAHLSSVDFKAHILTPPPQSKPDSDFSNSSNVSRLLLLLLLVASVSNAHLWSTSYWQSFLHSTSVYCLLFFGF